MLKIKFFVAVSILAVIAGSIFAQPKAQIDIAGTWLGTMKVSDAVELQVGYIISETEEGKLNATMNIIEQRAFDIPMDAVIVTQDSIQILFTAAGISYLGKFDASNNQITGHYKQGDTKLELNLLSVSNLPREVVRTQTPVAPFPYSEEEVIFSNSDANVNLAGTLTTPETGSNFPAIILVHGSGHTDRNETKMGHFMLLADYFTRNGFAVLRYDKRGVGSSSGSFDEATTIDFAKDVKAGINFLQGRNDIDGSRIGIIGHSEGTLIAPMVASEMNEVAFLVLMGAMGTNGGEIRLQQTEKISHLNGVDDLVIKKDLEQIKGYHAILKTDHSKESKFEAIKAKYPELSDGLINYFLNPWYGCFIQLEPAEFLAKVKCPVLAISGDNDVQCPPVNNLPLIEAALIKAENTNFSVQSLPKLNHLFQTSKTGLPLEYDNIAEIIAPSALNLILDWVLKNSI